MTEQEAMKLRAAFDARIDALWTKHSVGELTEAQVRDAIDVIFDTMDEATEEAMFTDYAIRLVDFDDDPCVVCNREAWCFSFNDQQWHPADRCAMTYKGYLCTPQAPQPFCDCGSAIEEVKIMSDPGRRLRRHLLATRFSTESNFYLSQTGDGVSSSEKHSS